LKSAFLLATLKQTSTYHHTLPKPQAITHYHSSPWHDLSLASVDAGQVADVVLCVARLFQKGAIVQISLNSSHVLFKSGKGHTYEVHFLRGGRTLKRRFTVYRLGGLHSKSVCYQVTDPKGKYMVVKIPPQPITDIIAYLLAVAHERQLAQKIIELGIKVVVPCVSSVMKHLHKLDATKKMSLCEMEDAYLAVLQLSGNQYADQFRIKGNYVFFMEYLDDPFLGKVVREFYNKEMLINLKREYFEKDLILLHKHDKIGLLYKYKHIGTVKYLDETFNELQQTFKSFSRKVDSISNSYSTSLGMWKKKDWFVNSSLGKSIDESSFFEHGDFDNDDKALIVKRLNTLLKQTAESSKIKRYLDILDQEAHWTAFKYGSGKMKMIGNNLLMLLVLLESMGLILRDLKVDNLFIADDEDMELGVIDLETGGYIGSGKIEGIVPAGMPSNMTISNLLFVNQLQRIYGEENLSTILHMQDWYATISMMYETTIGSILFDDARNYIILVNREIDARLAINHSDFVRKNPGVRITPDMIESFFSLSDEEIKGRTWQFWTLAQQNLQRKCLQHKTKLTEIEYELPPELKRKFTNDIEEELQQIQDKYRSYKLTTASIDYLNNPTTTITVLQNNLALKELLFVVKKNHRTTKNKINVKLEQEIDIYKDCITQKQKEEELLAKKNLLNQEHISAFDLLPIMLHFITKVMCQDEWCQYRPEAVATSIGRKYTKSLSNIASEDWKSTIFTHKDALAPKSKYKN